MVWQTPKTNWNDKDAVRPSDMNRIEGNILELKKAATIDIADTAGNFAATNVEDSLQELAGNVKNGKTSIANAITAMGQSASGGDTFDTLAEKIRDISKDATAGTGDVLSGKTFYQGGAKKTGTMPNRGAVTNTITTQGGQYTIPSGYHNGSGKVTASFSNLTAGNVKKGVNIGGIVGTVEPAPSIDSYNLSIVYAGDGSKFMGTTQYVRAPYTTNAYLFSVECVSASAFDISSSEYFYGGKTGSQGAVVTMTKRTTMRIGASSLDHYIVFNPLGATITFEGPDTGTIEYAPLIS